MDRLVKALDFAAILALTVLYSITDEMRWQGKRAYTEMQTRRILRQFRKTL